MVRINGEDLDKAGCNLLSFLQESKYNINRIVVELNYKILSREEYKDIVFVDGDLVEILNFVGGG